MQFRRIVHGKPPICSVVTPYNPHTSGRTQGFAITRFTHDKIIQAITIEITRGKRPAEVTNGIA